MFDIISRYFWAIAIAMTAINAAIIKAHSTRYTQENPELAKGYATLLRGYLIWLNIPWIVMGIGCTVGGIPSVWYYFRPQDGNPYVLAWYVSVFVVWIAGTYWLLFRDGAELLVKHPGVLNMHTSSPTLVKLIWFVSLAGGILGAIMMWTQNVPLPTTP